MPFGDKRQRCLGKPQALKKAFRNPLSYYANGKVVGVNYIIIYYYYLRNTQGNVVKFIDKTGATVVECAYDSWGKPLSTTGYLASTLGKYNPFRYRGYVYDEETGWYYLQSRYYNPVVGRFISPDVYLSTGQGVLGHNAYAYCLNNPINRSDDAGNRASWLTSVYCYEGGDTRGDWENYDIGLSKENEQILKGSIRISEKNYDEVRFMLNECSDTVLNLIQVYGEDKVCDKIAHYIRSEYYAAKGCELFASKSQLSYEIKTHIDGYFQSLSYDGYHAPFVFYAYYLYESKWTHEFEGTYLSFLEVHCRTIEINDSSDAEKFYYYKMRK